MMKKVNVTFEGVNDTTGYLFSLAKCFMAVVKNSPYSEYAEDVIAVSGFAFRMWVNGESLCPSATSIWDFKKQKEWFENSGLVCGYVQRVWDEDAVEETRRAEAIGMIEAAINAETAAVVWDLSGCEWGIINGYDGENERLAVLKIDGSEYELPYEKLGKLDIPILSALTVTGAAQKPAARLLADTKRLALAHLKGEEWCENAQGLAAYDVLCGFIQEELIEDDAWKLEYYLGTYAALKWYAWKFFEKYGEAVLAELYEKVYGGWKGAFDTAAEMLTAEQQETERKAAIIKQLRQAWDAENAAAAVMAAEM